jgi:hypothetical protein
MAAEGLALLEDPIPLPGFRSPAARARGLPLGDYPILFRGVTR